MLARSGGLNDGGPFLRRMNDNLLSIERTVSSGRSGRRWSDSHLFTDLLDDFGLFPEFGRIAVADCEVCVLMPLLRTESNRTAVRAGANHLQRQVCVVAMDADKDAGALFVVPDG